MCTNLDYAGGFGTVVHSLYYDCHKKCHLGEQLVQNSEILCTNLHNAGGFGYFVHSLHYDCHKKCHLGEQLVQDLESLYTVCTTTATRSVLSENNLSRIRRCCTQFCTTTARSWGLENIHDLSSSAPKTTENRKRVVDDMDDFCAQILTMLEGILWH